MREEGKKDERKGERKEKKKEEEIEKCTYMLMWGWGESRSLKLRES